MNSTTTFQDVFLSRMFVIPDYQRGYAWEDKHLDDLLEDLELLRLGRKHYTGTLVVCKKEGERFQDANRQNYELFDVIDGQQRLTTIVIFLDVIHDEFQRLNMQSLADNLERIYLCVRDRNNQIQTKLTLHRDSQAFFYNNVLGISPSIEGSATRSQQNLLHAHGHINAFMAKQKDAQGDEYKEWICTLYDKITQGLTVILYEVESEMDAGVIFETMNDRGKELTDLEKVKNHLLYLASKLDLEDNPKLQERINTTWKFVFEQLMASGLGDDENEGQLLRVHWLMVYDPIPKNWKRYETIKKFFSLKLYQGQDKILLQLIFDYLDSLRDTTRAYCDILNPQRDNAFDNIATPDIRAKVIEISEKLVRMGSRATFLPVLCAVRLRAGDGGEGYLKVAELCEKFGFRVYLWLRYYASAGQSIFFRLGRQYFEKPNTDRLVASISRTTLDYSPDERFLERFQRETEDWYQWSGLKYFLYEYELHLAEQAREPVHMEWNNLWDVKRDTIEHILPQTPTQAWLLAFPDEKLRKRWLNDIGNLTLTYDNSSLFNKSFADKKGDPSKVFCYASSSFFIERQLAALQQWTEVELLLRREQIKAWSLSRWHVDKPTIQELPENGDGYERIMRLAEDGGVEGEYQVLLDYSKKYDLYLRPFPSCMMFAPKANKIVSLFTAWPREGYLDVVFWFEGIEKYQGMSIDTLNRIFEVEGRDARVVITTASLEETLEKMNQVFSYNK